MSKKLIPDEQRKIKISVYLNKNLVLKLKEKKINISEICNDYLLRIFKDQK